MSYAIVHMQKFSKGSVRGIQSHNQREKQPHTNPDVNMQLSHLNYDIQNTVQINYHRQINEKIQNQCRLEKAVRKDAVVLCNFIVTSDSKFFEQLPLEHQEQFFTDSYNFFAKRYGKEKIVNATVHLDEKTPHMHLGLVPVTIDKRLSAKTLFDKKELKSLQTEFIRQVGAGYGLERGVEGSERTHLTEQRYKTATAYEEQKRIVENTSKIIEKAQNAEGYIITLSEQERGLKEQINTHTNVLEDIERKKRKTEQEISQEEEKIKELEAEGEEKAKNTESLRMRVEALQRTLDETEAKILSVKETGAIRVKKTITGSLRGISYKEIQSLIATAKLVDEVREENTKKSREITELRKQASEREEKIRVLEKEKPSLKATLENAKMKTELRERDKKIDMFSDLLGMLSKSAHEEVLNAYAVLLSEEKKHNRGIGR